MSKQGIDFRWGVPLLDDQPGYAKVYEFMLDHYAEVVTRDEFLCIVHLARYHYNSVRGESRPSLETIAKQMGYAHKNSVWRLVQSLEAKGMLTVTRRTGFTSIYNASPFTLHMMALAGITPGGVTLGGVTPQCDGGITSGCDGGITLEGDGVSHPGVPEEEKDKETRKEQQQKSAVVVSSQPSKPSSLTPERAAQYQEQYQELKARINDERRQASHLALTTRGVEDKAALCFASKIESSRVLQVCLAADLKEGIEDKAAWIVSALNDGWAVKIPRDDEKPKSEQDRLLETGQYRVKDPRTGDWKAPGEI